MTPLKALAAFSLGLSLLVGTGIALATTDFAQGPVRDGYGVSVGSASTTHGPAGTAGGRAAPGEIIHGAARDEQAPGGAGGQQSDQLALQH